CQTPGKVPPSARRLAGEPQTAFFRPSPNTPSKASLPPLKQEEVLRRDALLEGVLDPAFVRTAVRDQGSLRNTALVAALCVLGWRFLSFERFRSYEFSRVPEVMPPQENRSKLRKRQKRTHS